MNIEEDFWRCTAPDCNSGEFYIDKKFILAKDTKGNYTFNDYAPRILETKRQIICANCGKTHKRRDFLNNE